MRSALSDALSRVWLLEGLSEEELGRLSRLARTRVYKPREVIVRKGDAAEEVFVLLRGRAKVGAPGAQGADATMNLMGRGEVFGEIAILDGQPRSATVTALEECEIAVVDKPAFNSVLASSPSIAVKLLGVLAGRVRELTTRIEDRAFLDVSARLAKELLRLAKNHGSASGSAARIELRLSQQELGDLIGATRESVNKQLREWTRTGIVKQERDRIEILDIDALTAIAEGREDD